MFSGEVGFAIENDFLQAPVGTGFDFVPKDRDFDLDTDQEADLYVKADGGGLVNTAVPIQSASIGKWVIDPQKILHTKGNVAFVDRSNLKPEYYQSRGLKNADAYTAMIVAHEVVWHLGTDEKLSPAGLSVGGHAAIFERLLSTPSSKSGYDNFSLVASDLLNDTVEAGVYRELKARDMLFGEPADGSQLPSGYITSRLKAYQEALNGLISKYNIKTYDDLRKLDSSGRLVIDEKRVLITYLGLASSSPPSFHAIVKGAVNALTNVDGGQIGVALGSVLGRRIASDPFGQIVASGTLSTVLGTVGELIDENIFGGSQSTWDVKDLITGAERSFSESLGANIKSAGVGALSSYLTAELFKAVGVDGLAGELGQSVAGGYVGAIINNLSALATNQKSFADVLNGVSPVNIVGAFIGTKLAAEIKTFESVGGQIGSAVGAAYGGYAATVVLSKLAGAGFAGLANPGFLAMMSNPGTAVAAVAIVAAVVLISTLFGGTIGSIFGGTPRSGADVAWNPFTGQFNVAGSYAKYGGSKQAAVQISQGVANSFNAVLAATGSKMLDPKSVQAGNYGMRKSDYVYRPVRSRDKDDITAKFDGKTGAQELITHGVYLGLSDMIAQLGGGDVHVKRAVAGSLVNARGNPDSDRSGASGDFSFEALLGDMSVARDYANYLENTVAIQALIAADPQTAFAAGWLATLARAVELGLHRRNATDWVGGFGLWMDEVSDGAVDGAGLTPTSFTAAIDPSTRARYWSVNDGAGTFLGYVEDSIEASGQDVVAGTAGNDIIRLGGTELKATGPATDSRAQAVASTENYNITLNGAGFNGTARTIEVAAYVDAGGGNDFVYASDRGDTVLGGAGNDWLIGGKLDDWLFGGDGHDLLYAAAVVPNGALSLEAATLAQGGNGNYLDGGAGSDYVIGSAGSDWLVGGADVDIMFGGAGGDILDAGMGNDTAVLGGAGSDQYIFRRGDGRDVYNDSETYAAPALTADSVSLLVRARTDATAPKNWAGDGDFTVDGNTKGGEDAIVFGAGISLVDLLIERSGTTDAPGMDLIIKVQAPDGSWDVTAGDQMVVKNWFDGTRKIEWLRFADGDEFRLADVVSFQKGTAGADVLVGTAGKDFIYGGAGDDKLWGLASNDFVAGGLGDDLVSGNDDNDIVLGGNDADVVLGGLGFDLVSGDGGNDRVYGGGGNDFVSGGRGDDELVGGSGDDIFRFERGDGRDTVYDEYAGTWEIVWQPVSDTVDGVNDGWVNGYAVDSHGNVSKNGVAIGPVAWDGHWDYNEIGGNKTLKRLIAPATGALTANSGTDTIEFGIGIDPEHILFQRAGNDIVLAVGSPGGADAFAEVAGQLRIKEWYLAPGAIEGLTFVSTGKLDISAAGYELQVGTDGNDTLTGNARPKWATGGAGDDYILGSGFADIINGGSGSDTLVGFTGVDVLYGGLGQDVLVGGAGPDALFGGSGADTAAHNAGAVIVYLDEAFRAYRSGDAKGDSFSSLENLSGSESGDLLVADAGSNLLRGGGGADSLYGGGGDDIYVFAAGFGIDTIVDGQFTVRQVVDAAGALLPGFTTSWTLLNTAPTATGHYFYRAQIKDAAGVAVYDSGTALAAPNYSSTSSTATPSFAAASGAWNVLADTFASEFWKVSPTLVAGNGGEDTLELEAGLSFSNLAFVRSGNDLEVQYDAATKAVLKDFFASSDTRVETIHLADGFFANLAAIRLLGEASTAEVDLMVGDAAANSLLAGAGNDTLSGSGGNDLLYGEAGDDVLEGGAGGDLLDGGHDSVTAGLPLSTDAYGDTVRYAVSAAAVTINLLTGGASGGDAAGDTLVGIENVTGSRLADSLSGDNRANRLLGLDGDDTMSGLDGADVLVGGAGHDQLAGGGGEDNLSGGDGNDSLTGDDGRDILDGGDGGDTLRGGAGDDTLLGGAGNDSLLDGEAGNDLIVGGDGDDVLRGGLDQDRLVGEAGNDILQGDGGNDLLSGGAGNDSLEGGSGDDSYVFDAAAGQDRVNDASGVNQILLSGATSDQVWLTRVGDDLKLSLIGASSSLTIVGYFAVGGTLVSNIAAGEDLLFLRSATGPDYATSMVAAMTAHSASIGNAPPASIGDVPAAIRSLQESGWANAGAFIPQVSDQTYTMAERSEPTGPGSTSALTGSVQALDADNNIAGPSGYSLAAQPRYGTVSFDPAVAGSWTYVPTTYFNGVDSFRVRVVDADGNAAEQNVTVNVTPVNSRPLSLSLSGPIGQIVERDRPQPGQYLGAVDIGLLVVNDPDFRSADALGTPVFGSVAGYSFTLSDSRFEVAANGHLYLKAGMALDFEQQASIAITATATDPGGLSMITPGAGAFPIVDQEDYLEGAAGADSLTGQDSRSGLGGNDRLIGNAGADTIRGLSGRDFIRGGPDDDALYGDTGNDEVYGDDGHDRIEGGEGSDHLDGGTGNDTIVSSGTLAPDTLIGGYGNDQLYGGDGNDTIDGGDGDDFVQGGLGADTLMGGNGAKDTISYLYSPVAVTVSLADGIYAEGDVGSGFEQIAGSHHGDTLTGDGADNALNGWGGDDIIHGRGGNDTISGATGSDTIHGEDGADLLEGNEGNDQLVGGAGNDILNGREDNDSLFGSAGDDILDGGAGSDFMDGGDGSDIYIVRGDSGADTISNMRQADSTDRDVIGYQGGVVRENLWFQRVGNDMLVSIVGTATTTTIANWFVTTSSVERTNFKIDFFVAQQWSVRSMNSEAMVAFMATRAKPASQSEFDAWRSNPSVLAQWENHWVGNEPPTLTGVPDSETINEDGTLTVTIRASDDINTAGNLTVEAKAVSPSNNMAEDLSVVHAPSVGPADANGDRVLTVRAQDNASGPVDIKVKAIDAGGLLLEKTFRLNVIAVADKPTVTQATYSGTTIETGALPISLQATVLDPSELIDHFTVSNVPAALSFNMGTDLGGGTWRFAATQVSATSYTVAGLALNQKPGWFQDLTGGAALRIDAQSREAGTASVAVSDPAYLAIVLNGRPTEISLTSGSLAVAENGAPNAVFATLSGTDPDGETPTLSLLPGHDGSGQFRIEGGQLSTTRSLNYEEGSSYVLKVRAVDGLGLDIVRDFTVSVSDANEAAVFTSTSVSGVNENVAPGTIVGGVAAGDVDGGSFGTKQYWFAGSGQSFNSVDGTFAISETTPDGLFSINPATGEIRTAASLDRETLGASRAYTVLVRDATNSPRATTAPITIAINDVNEAPTITTDTLGTLSESMPGAGVTPIVALGWTDLDSTAAFRDPRFDIVPGEDAAMFSIDANSGQIFLQGGLDYEKWRSHAATFRITDAGGTGHSVTRRLVLSVSNANDKPASFGEGGIFPEGGRVGQTAAMIYPEDPDVGDTTTFSIINVERSEDGYNFGPTPRTPYRMQYSQTGYPLYSSTQNAAAALQVNGSIPWQKWVVDRITVRVTDAGGLFQDVVVEVQWNTRYTYLMPVVLDLDGDGVELTSAIDSPVRFDADGDGIKDQIGWAGADDGLLVLDRNRDGEINELQEISFAADLEGAQSDLEGLAAFDTDANGFFDARDARFEDFQVWRDANQDGTSEPDELKSLADWGISAIDLAGDRTGSPVEGARDNVVFATSEYYRRNGSTGDVADAFFAYYSGAEFLPNGKPRPGATPRFAGIDPGKPLHPSLRQGKSDGSRAPGGADEPAAGNGLPGPAGSPAAQAAAAAAVPDYDPLTALRSLADARNAFDASSAPAAPPASADVAAADVHHLKVVDRMVAAMSSFGAGSGEFGTFRSRMPDSNMLMLAASH